MYLPVLQWYITVQVVSLVALPMCWRMFANLPDRGYGWTKLVGIFGTGLILWLGTSYGILRNERGGALLALLVLAILSSLLGRRDIQAVWRRRTFPTHVSYVAAVEFCFATILVVWALVRSYDPAANHTEQPMDLMFLNSIAASPTFPPVDAWLAGYPISYYYFGYWLLATLAQLAAVPLSVAYNVGQACWYSLLFISTFALAASVVELCIQGKPTRGSQNARPIPFSVWSLAAGLIGALAVCVSGNLQFIAEWLYANGILNTPTATWLSVSSFPQEAAVTHRWFVDEGWWWWRTSRVFEDLDLSGGHIEVISEFPAFSYLLGDNHPHVLAMPFAVMVMAIGLSILVNGVGGDDANAVSSTDRHHERDAVEGADSSSAEPRLARILRLPETLFDFDASSSTISGIVSLALLATAVGGLLFLNTWDFLPYWVLLAAIIYYVMVGRPFSPAIDTNWQSVLAKPLVSAITIALMILVGGVFIYLPYFLSAQSQAQGVVPNLFYPTKLRHLLLMFGGFLPIIIGYLVWSWYAYKPELQTIATVAGFTFGIPAIYLVLSAVLALNTPLGRASIERMVLPDSSSGYLPYIIERWLTFPFAALLIGALLTVSLTYLRSEICTAGSRRIDTARHGIDSAPRTNPSGNWSYPEQRARVFLLLVLSLGLGLVFVPEFVYLRDNFGTRMNTVFKFHYQAWLLFGVFAGCAIVLVMRSVLVVLTNRPLPSAVPGTVVSGVFVLMGCTLLSFGLLFPVAGAYGKTNGFRIQERSLDAVAYIRRDSPDEWAAADWIRKHTSLDAIVLEGKGASYWATYNRMSTITGRPTLLGWDGHESQWRGAAYGAMASGRPEAIATIYRSGSEEQVNAVLNEWDVDYVYLGPTERAQYEVTPRREEELSFFMDTVFEQGSVKIFRRRY